MIIFQNQNVIHLSIPLISYSKAFWLATWLSAPACFNWRPATPKLFSFYAQKCSDWWMQWTEQDSNISLFSMTGKWFPHSLMYSDKEALSKSGKKMIHWRLMGRFCARLNLPNTKKWHHVPSPCFGMCLIGFRTDEEPEFTVNNALASGWALIPPWTSLPGRITAQRPAI